MTTPRPGRPAKERDKERPVATPAPGDEPQVPSGAEEEFEPVAAPDPGPEPLPKEYLVLDGPASFGPVVIDGQRTRAVKNKLYHVPQLEERADILSTGFFRSATRNDLARSEAPSAGPGGAVTRDLLPPGALKKE